VADRRPPAAHGGARAAYDATPQQEQQEQQEQEQQQEPVDIDILKAKAPLDRDVGEARTHGLKNADAGAVEPSRRATKEGDRMQDPIIEKARREAETPLETRETTPVEVGNLSAGEVNNRRPVPAK
jgi:hypothetical protein